MLENCSAEINLRAQKVLRSLIECYIRDGQPIGSKTLAQTMLIDISPASVRNIMSDLEAAGFLQSPHISAGRVPTVKGYRFFVDSLINVQPLTDNAAIKIWSEKLRSCVDVKSLVTAASSMLVGMTRMASVVMLPRPEAAILQHIEFLPLNDNRVLIILVLHKHDVQNRIIHTDRCYTRSELQTIGNYLTANFAGKELCEIKRLMMAAIQQDQSEISYLTQIMVDMLSQTLGGTIVSGANSSATDYVLAGEANLFDTQEQEAHFKLRDLFAAFAAKRDILYLLNQCLGADGIKIYIGEESGYAPLDDCSLVTVPYREGGAGKVMGVLGVIGPTRMAYDRAMAAVDVTAKLLSAALEELE